jgi:mortality factor 4-like protein 1
LQGRPRVANIIVADYTFTASMPPASADSKPMYQKDEKALCFHGELLYEAKVLEVKKIDPKDKNSPHEYRVHYKGWKNT